MFNLRDISIKNKLILMQVLVSMIVLGLCIAAFVYTDIKGFKERKIYSVNAIAHVISTNSVAAIQFLDNDAAKKNLSQLIVEDDIVNASILDKKGNTFASYTKQQADSFRFAPSLNGDRKVELLGNYLYIYSPIEKDQERLGTVCLRVQLSSLDKIVSEELGIGSFLLIIGVGLSFLISFFVQSYITRPLLRLIKIMQTIKGSGDYKSRAMVEGHDEINTLSMEFNDMLSQIEKRDNEMESRVKERTAELETANNELESFSYSVSHDMRAPLRAVSGFSNILTQGYSNVLDEEGKESLRFIRNESVRMGQLIDDLLAFSRLGKKDIQKSMVDMKALADEALQEVLNTGPEKYSAEIKIDALPAAYCDGNLVRQVFINLISNALKYSSHKAHPMVHVGFTPSSDNRKNNYPLTHPVSKPAVYFVKDNGVGFDMKYYHKLFGVFQRLHSQEEFKGTGIGLAIVQRVITRHGGNVWAESAIKEGSTFYFSLPSAK